jgi:hypothetical protein
MKRILIPAGCTSAPKDPRVPTDREAFASADLSQDHSHELEKAAP